MAPRLGIGGKTIATSDPLLLIAGHNAPEGRTEIGSDASNRIAKLGILTASVLASIIGSTLLLRGKSSCKPELAREQPNGKLTRQDPLR
jgi:hypothetical protein